ncbi:MAG: methyltransferase [Oscillospiraceae bacterium]|nr:methyltransferase [Oscillospiraceae bacterium]
MAVGKFDPKELEYIETPGFFGPTKTLNYPISQHDNGIATFKREPWWQMQQATPDAQIFATGIIPDNIARAFVVEGGGFFQAQDHDIKPDMFGIEWEYIAQVGGSMVRPGKPLLEDIAEWREKLVWPDISKWDWEGAAAKNKDFLKPDNFNQLWFQTGWYERLISFMDFENAIMAIFDEDSQDDVKALFDKLTDLYIDIFDHVVKYFPEVHAFFIHDDWGSQKAPFFSPDVAEEMIVPYMKRVTDFLHSKGKFCELHSCGNNYRQVENYIKAGWDAWAPQLMNDGYKIYDDFGDRILIATWPQNIPEEIMALGSTDERGAAFAALPEEQQRAIAREYVDRTCQPGKSSFYNFYAAHFLTPAFKEEMYIQSRKNYSK